MTDVTVREHWIDTADGRIFVRDWLPPSAQGVPIILLHDSLGCVALWRDFPEQLVAATGHRVIAYDRLGFGRSDAHPGRLARGFVEAQAQQEFTALLNQLEVDAFMVFGHSVGGGMAVACAAEFAGQCQALIIESAQAFVEDLTLQGIREADRQFAVPGQLERLSRYHGNKAEWVLRAWVDTWLSPAFADWNLDALLAKVHCPMLCLHGDLDEFGSLAHPRRFSAMAAGPGVMHVLAGCGHVPHREQATVVLDEVQRFLG